jgi:GntR family transcriptional regulator, gluconate operon transcriptional repressor
VDDGREPALFTRTTLPTKLPRSLFSGRILAELRMAVINGQLPKGTRLVEHQLAADFGVSRGPVRSALQVLEGEGLVETLQSGGMASAGFSVDDLASLFRVRHLLEAAAIRYGVEAESPTASVEAALEQLMADSNEARFVEFDIAFHRTIVEFGKSRFLLRSWASLAPVIEAVVSIGHMAATSQFAAEKRAHILEAHIPIVDALKAGKADRAEALLDEQFRDAEAVLREYFRTLLSHGNERPRSP